jgi:hypothetical protein
VICHVVLAIGRRALEETGADSADRERRADEERRPPAREVTRILQPFDRVLLSQRLRESFDLIGGLFDVARGRIVLVLAQVLRAFTNGGRDGAKSLLALSLCVFNCAVAESRMRSTILLPPCCSEVVGVCSSMCPP